MVETDVGETNVSMCESDTALLRGSFSLYFVTYLVDLINIINHDVTS